MNGKKVVLVFFVSLFLFYFVEVEVGWWICGRCFKKNTQLTLLILQENSIEFNDKNYLQIHGTAMGTKMAVGFANTWSVLWNALFLTENLSRKTFSKVIAC